MSVRLAMVTIVVDDYDRGIALYEALGFGLVEDVALDADKRWVVMEAAGGSRLLLARANESDQAEVIGRQAGGRVGFFLETDDIALSHADMVANGVTFEEDVRHEPYGKVAVFRDGYGNRWDLIESSQRAVG